MSTEEIRIAKYGGIGSGTAVARPARREGAMAWLDEPTTDSKRRSGWTRGANLVVASLMLALPATPTSADPISVTFSGVITSFSDPDGIVHSSIGLGDPFTGSYTLDPDAAVFVGTDGYGDFLYEVGGGSASVLLEGFVFENTTGSMGPFYLGIAASVGANPVVGIWNDRQPPFVQTADGWEILLLSNASAIAAPLPGPGTFSADAQSCGIGFFDSTATRLTSGSFFVNTSTAGWGDGAHFGCFDLNDLSTPLLLFSGPITTMAVVPEPGTGALVMLGFALLTGIRRRRG